jgi:hypothetical protein
MSKPDLVIKDIVKEFNFEAVRCHMVAVDWTWAGRGIPTIDELKECAFCLLHDVANSKHKKSYSATGGFFAYKWGREITLLFNIQETSGTLPKKKSKSD